MNTIVEKFTIHPDNAAQILGWLKAGRGVAHWVSQDLSDPGFALTTPAYTETGEPTPKPHWKVANEPEFKIWSAADILVGKYELYKRIHVGLQRDCMRINVTDGGSRRIRRFLSQAGDGSFYCFADSSTFSGTDVEIFKLIGTTPLSDWSA